MRDKDSEACLFCVAPTKRSCYNSTYQTLVPSWWERMAHFPRWESSAAHEGTVKLTTEAWGKPVRPWWCGLLATNCLAF